MLCGTTFWALVRECLPLGLRVDRAKEYTCAVGDGARHATTNTLFEVESLNGAIVRMAKEVDLEAPANVLVTRLVRGKEKFFGVSRTSDG